MTVRPLRFPLLVLVPVLVAFAGALCASEAARAAGSPALWPDAQRAFFLDGPAWLLTQDQRNALLEMSDAERGAFIDRFLSAADLPAVSADEMAEAIRRRRRLVQDWFPSPLDVRARLLFLNGPPVERQVVDCGETFHPLEIWRYPKPVPEKEGDLQALLPFQPGPGAPWRLWTPYDGKKALYTDEMAYYLKQWHELNGKLFRAARFDLQTCEQTKKVDDATGVNGLVGFKHDRPTAEQILAFIEPPVDLGIWVQQALRTPMPQEPPELATGELKVYFPDSKGQRLVTRYMLPVPDTAVLQAAPADSGDGTEYRLVVEGTVEEGGSVFDQFRVRFVLPAASGVARDEPAAGEDEPAADAEAPAAEVEPAAPETPAGAKGFVLVWDELLRPDQDYVVRLRLRDEVGGAATYLADGFRVPSSARPGDLPPRPEAADRVVEALSRSVAETRIAGEDSLILVPPVDDVVLGLWRAEAIVSGERIEKVAFSVDGEKRLTDTRPPYSAELRLAKFPKEQVVRADGLDASGQVVASDDVVINQPRGAFAVRITDPPQGVALSGEVPVTAQVVVPEGRRVEEVVFEVAGEQVARLEHPPWQATVRVPDVGGLTYLSVTARLDDGRSGEDVRLLNAPDFVGRVDVDLVELYAAVTDRDGHPVHGLTADDFTVKVEGKPTPIERFETVDNLPLTVGITIDSSGSMADALTEAQKAAREFLHHVVGLQDHAFSVGFASTPALLMPPTADADAVADSLGRLQAVGSTALHDAVVTSLYYFRGFPGQRVMVLLSDGDDTSSNYSFEDTLEYARRSGVAIYSVGLKIGRSSLSARSKLKTLAEETGGRVFFISKAEELEGVYGEIEEELRSRYMLAITPEDRGDDTYQEVEVEVDRRGVDVRTARGIYP